jgi:hypothetical protein
MGAFLYGPLMFLQDQRTQNFDPLREFFIFLLVLYQMRTMDINIKLDNPCAVRKDFCVNCHNHFMMIRPLIKGVNVSKHFIRDLKNKEEVNSIINNVLDCAHLEFAELHKFEENIDGNLIFRAKKKDMHIVYCVDKMMRIIFLRAIKNYTEYRKFLEDKREIKRVIARAQSSTRQVEGI